MLLAQTGGLEGREGGGGGGRTRGLVSDPNTPPTPSPTPHPGLAPALQGESSCKDL